MKGKLLPGLWTAAIGLLVLIVVVVGWSLGWFGAKRENPQKPITTVKPGETIDTAKLPDPPPPPKTVPNPNRVKENLKKGKTYVTTLTGSLRVKAAHTDFGIEKTYFLHYVFGAKIDREIEDNDGTTVVELRHFREVGSGKLESELDDVRLDLDSIGDGFFRNVPLADNLAKFSLKPVLRLLRGAKLSPEKLLGLDPNGEIPDAKLKELSKLYKAATRADRLSGKSVRLTYKNGQGITKIESVKGEFNSDELHYLRASVLLSDSLIVPNVDIGIGDRGTADGSNFAGFLDPSLLASSTGEVTWKRTDNQFVKDKKCLHLEVIDGTVNFEDSNRKEGKIGHFRPRGSLFFSPDDQIIIKAKLSGTGEMRRFSKDHWFFQESIRGEPDLEFRYQCVVIDTPK